MEKIGITTAVIAKPKVTNHQLSPDCTPKNGGRIRFPAPKNIENKAKPVIKISLDLFIL